MREPTLSTNSRTTGKYSLVTCARTLPPANHTHAGPRAALVQVMQRLPALTYFGIASGESVGAAAWISQRLELLDDSQTFQRVCAWLPCLGTSSRINPGADSYGLKHIAEDCLGEYVANGTFIAAAVHLGYRYRVYPDSPNVTFAMSRHDIHTAWQRGLTRKYSRVAS